MTKSSLISLILTIGLANSALATTAITIDGTNDGYADAIDRVIGWEFTVGPTELEVTDLGVFDFNMDGLVHSHEVGIWTFDGSSLLTSAVVPAGTGSALDGFFRTVSAPNAILSADTSYVIGATWDASGDEMVWDDVVAGFPSHVTGFSVDPSITLGPGGSARFNAFTSVFAYPQFTDSSLGLNRAAFWGPNFNATAVPLPSAFFLLGAGLSGLVLKRRNRSSGSVQIAALPRH